MLNYKFSILPVFSCLFIVIICLGCSGNSGANNPNNANTSANDKSKLGGLYVNYHANPQGQDQIDENKIIEYATDKGLDCQRMQNGVYQCNMTQGSGEIYKRGQRAKAHYRGYLLNGQEFDSSFKRNQPLEFNIGQMIPGWNDWLVTVNPGTKATLLIPSSKAYGPRGFGSVIPANSPLAFDVECIE